MKSYKVLSIVFLGSAILTGCSSDKNIRDQISRVIIENPSILTEAIEKHPEKFMNALQNAAKSAQASMGKQREQDEQKQLEDSFNKPLIAQINNDHAFRGAKDAPITIVEYSDFQCPFCTRGNEVVSSLLKKYDGKIRIIYKHLPLSFHEQAMISSQYFEAIRLQNNDKAFLFHDEIFKNQASLKNGTSFLDSIAKKVGADMGKLKSDINSEKIKNKIAADIEEAGKFGMQGTPGFLINGIPVRGAYPLEHFVKIIDELQSRGKLKI